MAAPTFVAEYEATFNSTTTPKTVSATTAVGDVLATLAVAEGEVIALAVPTGGTPTYDSQESITGVNFCQVRLCTAVTGITAQTYTLSMAGTGGSGHWGFTAARFSGSDGVGAAEQANPGTNGAPSLAITTTQDNSALLCVVGDWNASDGASRTWRTINSITPTSGNGLELVYYRDASRYAAYVGYWNDVGAAGAKTVGLSAPTGQKFSIAAIEVKGTAGGQGAPRPPLIVPSMAAMRACW